MFWINGYAQFQVNCVVKTDEENPLETKFVDIFDRDQGFIKKAPIGEKFSFEGCIIYVKHGMSKHFTPNILVPLYCVD